MGTYLVQQKTNILPRAQENESCEQNSDCVDLPMYCEDGATRQCAGGLCEAGKCQRACEIIPSNPLSCNGGSITGTSETFTCTKDEADSGLPARECTEGGCSGFQYRRFARYDDANDNGFVDSNETVYCNWSICQDFTCPPGVKPPTAGTGSATLLQCKDNPVTPPSGHQWVADCAKPCTTNSECPQNPELPEELKKNSSWCFGFPGGNRCMVLKPGTSLVCTDAKVTTSYYDTKVATYLAYFEAIMRGVPEICTKADLGLEPRLEALAQKGGNDQRRLYLCSGKSNKPGNLNITWRVTSDNGENLVLTKETFSNDPKSFPNKDHVLQAQRLLGVSSTASQNINDPGANYCSQKVCTYSQGNNCFEGNCLNGSENCSTNVNCGYIPGCSSGKPVSC